ncbi:hypothetical protein DYB32_008648 [Aphanomyces invadans]|uniref:DUF7769 domain-containing protein n=1 Tax=Aphanomyces invadans TaxID=157072 RepID=A0A418AKH2_9STRA|nr:hypothetical protein DYB32_008648 [Aphanomyces invadans]
MKAGTKKKTFSDTQRQHLLQHLLQVSLPNGKLTYGTVKRIASLFNCDTRTIRRIWSRKLPYVLLCDRNVWADGCAKLDSVDYNILMRTLQAEVSASLEMMELCNIMESLNVKDEDDCGLTLIAMEILQLLM